MQKQYEMIETIFKDILPKEGFLVREEQIKLCKQICSSLYNRKISLSEAEVGIGKTLAYLIACIVNNKFRPTDERAKMNYRYSPAKSMPYIITTSNIELQKSIIKDYIPNISRILVKYNIIEQPITAVLRKGKKNYICDKKLIQYIDTIISSRGDKTELKQLERIRHSQSCDLDKVHIGKYDKQRICVTGCNMSCDYKRICRYYNMKNSNLSSDNMFQVCNHNYFVADLIHRTKNMKPLLPNYRAVIIDESHKLEESVKSLYKCSLEKQEFLNLFLRLRKALRSCGGLELGDDILKNVTRYANNLYDEIDSRTDGSIDGNSKEYAISSYKHMVSHIKAIALSLQEVKDILVQRRATQLVYRIDSLLDKMLSFVTLKDYLHWAESEKDEIDTLCSLPLDFNSYLKNMLWYKSIPIIMTSGTLSIDGNFDYYINKLSLKKFVESERLETSNYKSPYDYENNCMIYISDNTVKPDAKNNEYIESLASEMVELIKITKGRTLALFTSYNVLYRVYDLIKDKIDYPLILSARGNRNAVDEFKATTNGVLLSADAWEGIDVQGDLLSSLIITKLPFPIPSITNKVLEKKYSSFEEYLTNEVIPNMQMKLKQGFGRLIRHENDKGILSLLDARASEHGRYRGIVSDCLPPCRITPNIDDVKAFIQAIDQC